MKILYFDCFAGISGDMTLGALIDAGVDGHKLKEELSKLHLEGYNIGISKKVKNGITGTDVLITLLEDDHTHEHTYDDGHAHDGGHEHTHDEDNHTHDHSHAEDHVHGHQHTHHHRSFSDIKHIIENSDISDKAKQLSIAMFERLAKAEGKIHNTPYEEVHFHEVGALDSILDIVGTAICIDIIDPDIIISSPVPVGGGMVKCQHGLFPVPAPATLEVLKGVPIYSKGIQAELVTPTGAVILATLCNEYKDYPSMTIENIGYGLGKNNYEIPNCLRVCIGKSIKK